MKLAAGRVPPANTGRARGTAQPLFPVTQNRKTFPQIGIGYAVPRSIVGPLNSSANAARQADKPFGQPHRNAKGLRCGTS